MTRSRGWTQAVATIKQCVRGPEPVMTAGVAAEDRAYGLSLAGFNGAIRIGTPTYGVNRFSGDCGPLQTFGAGPFQAGQGIKGSLSAGQLPNTSTTTGATTNSVLAALAANQAGM